VTEGTSPGEESPPEGEPAKTLARTDEELDIEQKRVAVETDRAALEREKDKLKTDRANRQLREDFARRALVVMAIQIVVANAVFIWYGDTNGWVIPSAAISAWLGATVIQVVAVVLVIMNYLFPRGGPPE
jgi:hypothetical protein